MTKCFQVVEEGCIGNKWVKCTLLQCVLFTSTLFKNMNLDLGHD